MSFFKDLEEKAKATAKQLANEAQKKVEQIANDVKTKAINYVKAELSTNSSLTRIQLEDIVTRISKCTISFGEMNGVITTIQKMKKEDKISYDDIIDLLNKLCLEEKKGGYYHKKYLKYKHKYLNLKAQLNL